MLMHTAASSHLSISISISTTQEEENVCFICAFAFFIGAVHFHL